MVSSFRNFLLVIFLLDVIPLRPERRLLLLPKRALTPSAFCHYAPTALPEYVTRIRNAQYQLGATDALRIVQLADGKFEQGVAGGADYVAVTVTDLVAAGDLNNDGVNNMWL